MRKIDFIYQNFDIGLYSQMIRNNAFGSKEIYVVSMYIIEKIKQLCRPIDDDKISSWSKKIKQDLDNIDKIDVPKFLVNLFKEVIHQLEFIKKEGIKFSFLKNKSNNNNYVKI